MKFFLRLIIRLTGLTVSFTVFAASFTTICEHFSQSDTPVFTHTITHIIDSGLSMMPESAEIPIKNMLTALEDAVSGITENIISRVTP